MVFSTQIFLFVFFPICLSIYYLICLLAKNRRIENVIEKSRLKDITIIIFSLGFYMWSSFDNVVRLIFYILVIYFFSLWLSATRNKGGFVLVNYGTTTNSQINEIEEKRFYISKLVLIVTIVLVTFCLVYYNYSGFIINCWNKLFGANIASHSLVAPIGLSFITFSSLSYLIDIYRGDAKAGNLIDCFLFITFFPKIISGPIVLWKDFNVQIANRKLSLDIIIEGINRIMIGFAKKVILADSFGNCLASINLDGIDKVTAAGTVLLYMLQIYFDFAGYSDIAIGISKMFGFKFKENFNFPYRSKSISEFWRRWHISLGTWFREYIYIPLGGSRKGKRRTLINLAIVFAVTGIWHGAGWNYIIWGAINGICVLIERVIKDKKIYLRTPEWIKYIITMLIVMIFWQFFKYQDVHDVGKVFGIIFGHVQFENIPYNWRYFFDMQLITFAIIGILGSTLLGSQKIVALKNKVVATKIGYIAQEMILTILFVIAILFMVNSTYSPFIYFQY